MFEIYIYLILCELGKVMLAGIIGNQDLPTTTTTKMTDILNSPANSRKLKIELAVTVDAMDPFVRATHNLECDGPLSMSVCAPFMHILL